MTKPIRVIFLWDIAGFGSRISAWLSETQQGEGLVVHRHAYNTLQLTTSNHVLVPGNRWRFYWTVIKYLCTYHPTIIHIHSWTLGLLFATLIHPRTPRLIHYHGTDIRNKSIPRLTQYLATRVLVSTRDLWEYLFDYSNLQERIGLYGYPEK